MEVSVSKLITVPYSQAELDAMPHSGKIAILLGEEKVAGVEIIATIPAPDLVSLRRQVIALCERYDPTPIIVSNTNSFRDSFLLEKPFTEIDPDSIKEVIVYRAGDRAKVLEKKRQIRKSAGIDSEEELASLIQSKTVEAYKRGYDKPWKYVGEEIIKKYPKARELVEREWPPRGKNLQVALADPKSTIICRIFGKNSERMRNACMDYVKYYDLERRVGMISNRLIDL